MANATATIPQKLLRAILRTIRMMNLHDARLAQECRDYTTVFFRQNDWLYLESLFCTLSRTAHIALERFRKTLQTLWPKNGAILDSAA